MTQYVAQITEYLDLVFSYGTFWVYAAIFLACFIENVFPPFPGDTFILAAGGLVAVDRLDAMPALLAVVAGGLASIMPIFYLARRYGRDFFIRKNYRFFSASDVSRIEMSLQKWGGLILTFSRFTVGIRLALALGAGIGRYPPSRMLLYSTVSYLLFGGLLMYLAAKLVENFELMSSLFKTYYMIAWPVVILLLGVFVYRKVKNVREGSN